MDIIPIAWLLILTVGTIVTLINLTAAIDDRRRVHKRWEGHIARKRVADASVRNQLIITAIMMLFIMAGIVAIASSPPRTGIVALLLYSGLIGGALLLVTLSILERQDRKRLMRN